MRTIVSDRLVMRPWRADDADFLFNLESRRETVQYLGPQAKPMATKSEAIESIQRRRAIDHPIHGIRVIVDREAGGPLDNVLLKPAPLSRGTTIDAPVEVGWHLHLDAVRPGVLRDASRSGSRR